MIMTMSTGGDLPFRFGLGWQYPTRSARFAMRDIVREVAATHGLGEREIFISRRPAICMARFEAMHRCYEERHPDGRRVYSLTQIGQYFGKHHASVMNALRAHRERTAVSLRLAA